MVIAEQVPVQYQLTGCAVKFVPHSSVTAVPSTVDVLCGTTTSAVLVYVMITYADTALIVVPHNTSAVLGTAVTLECGTNFTAQPVNWYCTGTCSAMTTDAAVYLLLGGVLADSYADRVAIINNTKYVYNSLHCTSYS